MQCVDSTLFRQSQKHKSNVIKQWRDRSRARLSAKRVKPHIESVAQFIYQKYHPLQRLMFKNDATYFAGMLVDYARNSNARTSRIGYSRMIRDSINKQLRINTLSNLRVADRDQSENTSFMEYVAASSSGNVEEDLVEDSYRYQYLYVTGHYVEGEYDGSTEE